MVTQQIITTNDATVKSMTVEVKVMKIGNRQVTLAVFKQLPESAIIDGFEGNLRGTPWGHVNYHTDCGLLSEYEHLHVVWQCGDELRRSIVLSPSALYRLSVFRRNDLFTNEELLNLLNRTDAATYLVEMRDGEGFASLQEKYSASYTQLEQLDQLFIAV